MGQADTLAAQLADAAAAMTLPVADDAVCVTFLLSHGDVRRVHSIVGSHIYRSPKVQRVLRRQARLVALFAVLMLICGVVVIRLLPVVGGGVLVISGGLFLFAWSSSRRPRHTAAVARGVARYGSMHYPEYSYRQTTLIFDRQGYRAVSDDSVTRAEWSVIASVEVDEELVLLSLHNGTVLVLPVRAFASVAAMRAAGAKLIAWLDESGHGDANRLRRYLREKPTDCPFCKKSLDVERLQCSGCGEPVTRHLLPEVGIESAAHPPTVPGRVEG